MFHNKLDLKQLLTSLQFRSKQFRRHFVVSLCCFTFKPMSASERIIEGAASERLLYIFLQKEIVDASSSSFFGFLLVRGKGAAAARGLNHLC